MTHDIITLHGSYGDAHFNEQGFAILADDTPSEYANIAKLDVAEWRRFYPDESPVDNGWDILDWGYWTLAGQYEPARREDLML